MIAFLVIYPYMVTYMGFDISSSTIGLCIINERNKKFSLKHCEYYKPDKKVHMFESLLKTRNFAIERIKKWKPDKVVIEEIAEHFTGSGSTSKTIVKLATYNRTVGLAVYEALQKEPVMVNVNTARSILRPKGYKGRLAKEDVPTVVAAIMKCEFPWELNKKGKPAEESYDMADSMAVVLAHGALELAKNDTTDIVK